MKQLSLDGWVQKLVDGHVEAVFEGHVDAVERTVEWCYAGSSDARIEWAEYEEPENLSGFEIRRSLVNRIQSLLGRNRSSIVCLSLSMSPMRIVICSASN